MILEIVKYGHPALRQKGARVEKITPEIQKLAADMFETMYAFKGVGLAAQQVGQALQLTVLDVRGATERPSTLELGGKEADVLAYMPLALINPEVTGTGDLVAGSEGCLSFPEIYAEIKRPPMAEVRATNLKGEEISFRCGGLLSRAVQHELDHLNGILFIDRMARAEKDELREELDDLQAATKAALKKKK
ncbi:MAG TPA: peptide deformylase [Verrucomicrobiae bacterium]|jgi:peptide deformylase